MLNMLARAVGFSNYQSWRATQESVPAVAEPARAELGTSAAHKAVARLVRYYDREGRLTHWPRKRSWQVPCLWLIAEHIPIGAVLSEPQVNALISARHTFGDYALIRRDLVMLGALGRTPDGREYWRNPQAAPEEVGVLQRALAEAR
ncbi:DUF2087 domain-containing protein [Paludibacterium purpuratum]|nr:DUF2087 domain-containing protein [Paludibacterium purpuratum]